MTTPQQIMQFNRQFFRDLGSLIKPFWQSKEKYKAFLLVGLIAALIIIQVRVVVAQNTFFKNFYNAIQNFQVHAVITQIKTFAIIATIYILVSGYNGYFSGLLAIRWRRWMTQYFQNKWLDKHTYFKMQVLNKNVDNPDQRISEDLDSFPTTTISFFTTIFSSTLTLFTFGYILWNLSDNLLIKIHGTTWAISGYLVWAAIIYAIIGSWLTGLIGKKLTKLNYDQQFFNADFRFSLVRVRESSEQIALYRGENVEKENFLHLFKRIYNNFISIINLQKYLSFFGSGYLTLNSMIGGCLALPLYFEKKIQIGGIMQISAAYGEVIGAISIFVTAYTVLASWRSQINRLTEFSHNMEKANEITTELPISIQKQPQNSMRIQNLNIFLPNCKPLLQNINLVINSGETLLINGGSGSGKSTFLRTLAGIWPYADGFIYHPEHKKSLFLPQKPYLPLGSLREVLAYPTNHEDYSTEQFNSVLNIVGLSHLESSLDHINHWSHELSLGEQQLIAFARIFLHNPDWIFLDEATSALDESREIHMYESLYKHLPHVTVISVGHRSTLKSFHKRHINLEKAELQMPVV